VDAPSKSSDDRPFSQRAALVLGIAVAVGAFLYALRPANHRDENPPAPDGGSTAAPTAAVEESPEPEEGLSPRRVKWTDVAVDPAPGPVGSLMAAGRETYKRRCAVCHGEDGKGKGPAAGLLVTPPRNFTRGFYKFKSSLPGEMPFDEDLYRTITAGIPAAGMPSFADLTPFERWALVGTVKELTKHALEDGRVIDFFARAPAGKKMELAAPPPPEKIDRTRGAHLYTTVVQCAKCHGDDGRGQTPVAAELVDALDQPIRLPDLTRGEVTFKAGSRPEDIYRVITTGMAGTPMPSFTSVSDEVRWQLAHYVTSLYRPIPAGERVYLRVGCTSCHTVGKGKLIGPDLAGTTQRRKKDWLRKWLKDPPSMIAADPDARKLFEEYLVPMPSYGLTDREVEHLLQYLESLPAAVPPVNVGSQ
jgi:cytochrome c oxidase cbb3-type subunit 2